MPFFIPRRPHDPLDDFRLSPEQRGWPEYRLPYGQPALPGPYPVPEDQDPRQPPPIYPMDPYFDDFELPSYLRPPHLRSVSELPPPAAAFIVPSDIRSNLPMLPSPSVDPEFFAMPDFLTGRRRQTFGQGGR